MSGLPSPLRVRRFRLLWSALLTMRIGLQMIVVAVGWQVYAIHRSPFDLGLIGLMGFLPLPLLSLPAGHLSDRFSRRPIVICGLFLNVAVAVFLLLVTVAGAKHLWPFLVLASANGVANAVSLPAYGALIPAVIPLEHLAGAMALRRVAVQASVAAGPALGGALFAVRPELAYAVAAALFAVAFAAVIAMGRTPAVDTELASGWRSLVAGVRFVLHTRMLLGAIALDLFAVLFGGATALLPVYARSILDVGPIGLGALRSAPAVGALVAAVILVRRPLQPRAGPTLLVVVAAFGASMIVFGLSRSFPLSLAALVVSGLVNMVSVNIRSTTVALVTPDALRGRVLAVEMVFIGGSSELGAFESGVVAALVGTVAAVVAGGVATIGLALSWTKLFPALSRMGRLEDLRPAPAE